MPVTLNQFVELLTVSGVLSPDELGAFQAAIPLEKRPKDAQELARELVRVGKLTKYQAAALYQGRTKGLVLGNYVILDKLGAGGMGQVLKARHRRMNRIVALKVLPAEATKSPDNVKRFHREVEAAARLEHSNIVTAHDADEADGTHFLVMQYVEGKDLSAIVKENGPLPVPQAVECTRQAAQGLSYAHKHGVIHRDIKPANLLLSNEGTVKILDMGLARLEGQMQDGASVAGLTQSGQVMGTVDYMSPEQAEETRGVDHRADQYSLGCTLWVLLTGRAMFGGTTTIAKLMAHRTTPSPSLRAARVDVPEALETIYQRMVAKDPDERYPSMDEVIAALASCQGDAAPAQLDGHSSSDSQLTEFFRQIGGAKTEAPSVSVTDVDAETIQHQSMKEETGTEHFEKPALAPTISSVRPAPATARAASPSAARRQIHPLVLPAALVIGGLGSIGGLLALLLWLILPGGEPDPATNTERGPVVAESDTSLPLAIAPFTADEGKRHQKAWADYLGLPVEKEITLPGGEKLTLVLIPPGEFLMGSTDEERAKALEEATAAEDQWAIDRIPGEGPQHRVRITKPFYLGKYEVTQAQWQSVMGTSPSSFKDNPSHPVEQVRWDDIQPFLAKLNESSSAQKMEFALPTEAQWEYACRAGTTSAYSIGDNAAELAKFGWFDGNSSSKTHPVGQWRPNAFDLYDMHGNAWEWCADWYAEDYYAKSPVDDPAGPSAGSHRVGRGGSWRHPVWSCRSAYRDCYTPAHRHYGLGFRPAAAISGIDNKLSAASPAAGNTPPLPANLALEFDGVDDYIDVPAAGVEVGDEFTIEAWIDFEELAAHEIPNNGYVFPLQWRGNFEIQLIQTHPDDPERNNLTAQSTENGRSRQAYGREHVRGRRHVAVVRKRDSLDLYVDGKPGHRTQSTESTFNPKDWGRLRIGASHTASGAALRFFPGRMHEIRVSNVARYDKEFTPAPTLFKPDEHTVALYHFDEGSGTKLLDTSGHGRHGTIHGDPKWVPAVAPSN